MANEYGNLPNAASSDIKPFTAKADEEQLSELKTLIKLGKLPSPTYESLHEDRRYGVTSKWMAETKEYWLNSFNWRSHEDYINSFPNFITTITDDDGDEFDIHFTALFSKNPDAIPVIGIHGWPGSFLEFLPMMKIMKEKYSPDTLPFHFINPSLPGYVYSSRPPLHKNWTTTTAGDLLHKLMLSLGFGSGYMSTGGDIGANVARVMAGVYPECKGLLTNFCAVSPPEGWSDADEKKLDKMFQQGLERREQFLTTGYAYAYEHGTRTSTIGHALAASPLSLLAWIGEKFLTWTDTDPSTDDILGSVTLYWLTETFPRAIYSYRGRFEGTTKGRTHEDLVVSQDKVFGHLYYPKEIIAVPESWVARTGNLTFFKAHESGGHFAAFEKPEEMLDDITEFLEHAKQKGVTH